MGQEDDAVPCDRQEPWGGQERRRGPRRTNPDGSFDFERRRGDRRIRKPGLAALLGAILGLDDRD
jgi:hypothetical protein